MAQDDQWQREMQRYLAHFNHAGKRPTIIFSQHPQPLPVWTPAMDMYETAEALVILLELAGVDPERTEVHAETQQLVVRGMRRERHAAAGNQEQQRSYHALEIPYGRFERSIRLPAGLDTAAAQANYRDGLLEIRLPKRVARQVRINVRDAERAR